MPDCNLTFLRRINTSNPLSFLLHQFDLYLEGRRLARLTKFDLIVTRIELLSIGLFLLLKKTKLPYVIKHLPGYPRKFLSVQKGFRLLLGRIVAPFEEHLMRKFAANALAVDACTEGHIRGIVRNLKITTDKIQCVGNATNTERFKPTDKIAARNNCGLGHFDPIVGFAGGNPWERGGAEMVMVAPALIRKFPKIGFVVVGGGDGMERLTAAAAQTGVQEHFLFTGVVPYEDVPMYIASFDVGIALDKAENLQTIGNSNQKVRQYVASGKPVITTVEGNAFITENGLGSVVGNNDIQLLTRELVKWLILSDVEKSIHERKAVAYAREHLSVEKALEDRLSFWASKNGIIRAPASGEDQPLDCSEVTGVPCK